MTTVLSLWHGDMNKRPRMADIAAAVASEADLTLAHLIGRSRTPYVVHARQAAFAACYATGQWSLPTIGRFFGRRDHTTVLHGIRRAADKVVNATDHRMVGAIHLQADSPA